MSTRVSGVTVRPGPKLSGRAIVEKARKCYKLCVDTEADQRDREREDLEFQVAENQWDAAARQERMGGVGADGTLRPRKPMLSIDQLAHPMKLVYNSFVKSELGVLIHPVSADASDELAEAKQGLYRRIERDSNATQPRAWALNRAVKAGRGWWRVTTEYDEDGDDPFDQEIRIRRILYQQNVYMDPAAQEPDCSDAKWCLYVAWKDADDFAREFPDANMAKASSSLDWAPYESNAPDWVREDADGKRSALVAEYWWKDITTTTMVGPDGQKRSHDEVTVYCAKIGGDSEPLEEPYRWPGKYIPFVPAFGEELIPVESERRYQGMIRPARDAQKAFNYGFTTLVERAAKEPKTPFLADPRAIEGYEKWWDQANTRDFPYLPYKATLDGVAIPPPQRAQLDTTGLSIAQIVVATAKDGVQSATAIFDAGLGALPERRDSQSGRAIVALQQQGEAGTSQYVTTLAEVSMRYEALVVLDLMPHIYDRPGRITRILTGEDDSKTVMIGVPFIRNAKGFPEEAPEGHPDAEMIDLSKGKYSITISVGKSPQSKLEAGQQFTTDIVAAYPPVAEFALDLVFKYRDEPGAKEMADRAKKMIQSKFPFLFEDQKGGPEQAQAQLQALQQQLQQLQQQAQAMDEALKTKQVEQQAKIQVAQLEAQLKMQLAQIQAQTELQKVEMENAARIEVARIQSKTLAFNAQVAAEEEERSTGLKVGAEMAQTAVDHVHEERMAEKEHTHQAGMALHSAAEETGEPPEPPQEEASE